MKFKKLYPLILSILLPLAVGFLSQIFSGNMNTYDNFTKPVFSPPSYIFPIVWTILYTLMGISSYVIYRSNFPLKRHALIIYGIQLFFNFFWSILFFGLSNYYLAFVWLLILIVLIIRMIYLFYKIEPKAAYLQLPYLFWCIFAAILNLGIAILN